MERANYFEMEGFVNESMKDALLEGIADLGSSSQESGQPGQQIRDVIRWKLLLPLYLGSGLINNQPVWK